MKPWISCIDTTCWGEGVFSWVRFLIVVGFSFFGVAKQRMWSSSVNAVYDGRKEVFFSSDVYREWQKIRVYLDNGDK